MRLEGSLPESLRMYKILAGILRPELPFTAFQTVAFAGSISWSLALLIAY